MTNSSATTGFDVAVSIDAGSSRAPGGPEGPETPGISRHMVLSLPMYYENMPSSLGHSPSNGGNDQNRLLQAFRELCEACRAGDFETADSLLSTPGLDINQVDEWDYSPLILASLCGHKRIVELLLSRGAICDRDTFQGARCIYGALNDTIRDILISFDISKKVDLSQPFASHISSLLRNSSQLHTKDVIFCFPESIESEDKIDNLFVVDRFILAARSPYFHDKFKRGGKWYSKTVINMPTSTSISAFKSVLDYIYLRTDSLNLDDANVKDLAQFASKLKLNDLLQGIRQITLAKDKKSKSKLKSDISFMIVEKARKDLDSFLNNSVIASKIVSPLNLGKEVDLDDIDPLSHIDKVQLTQLIQSPAIPDIVLPVVNSETESIVYYPSHRAVLSRSEYFDTMLKSQIFTTSQPDLPYFHHQACTTTSVIDRPNFRHNHIPILQNSTNITSHIVAEIVLSFLYHDNVPQIPLPLSIDVLYAADELFLDRLKTMCAVTITSRFKELLFQEFKTMLPLVGYTPYDLIRISWVTRCDRLEQHITKCIAYNFKQIFVTPDEREALCSLICESASRIQERQDTDTIELVDDIRYYLSKKYAVSDSFADLDAFSEQFKLDGKREELLEDIKAFRNAMIDYERDIEMVDAILQQLDLDA